MRKMISLLVICLIVAFLAVSNTLQELGDGTYLSENKKLQAKKGQKFNEKSLSHKRSITVRNSNHFMDELIEIGGFSRFLKKSQ